MADSHEVEQWKNDLFAAGWTTDSFINWRAPDGSLWRGPYGAWKELQRRATVQSDLGLDTNFPLSETLRLLVEWAQHLHDSHECDCDGWEQRSFLIEAAQGYQREIMQSAATPAPAESADDIEIPPQPVVIQGIVERAGKARAELAEILQVPAVWPSILSTVKERLAAAPADNDAEYGPSLVAFNLKTGVAYCPYCKTEFERQLDGSYLTFHDCKEDR